MTYLVDTSVISEESKREPDPRVAAWMKAQWPDEMFLSVATVAEITYGIELLPDGRRRRNFQAWWRELVEKSFSGRVLAFDQPAAELCGTIMAIAGATGATVAVMDAIIAATARVHGLTVVTRNVSDIGRCGVQVLNPWKT